MISMNKKEDLLLVKAENIIPQSEKELRLLREKVIMFLDGKELIPPIRQEKLLQLAGEFLIQFPGYKQYIKLVAILINNAVWQSVVATVPFDRRVLLLPKCIRNSSNCSAKMDELGLLCEFCGGCKLEDYIEKAEGLGYHVIVSEGTGAVSVLLNSGQIECVIGVACLESFERSFPLSLKQAIPSRAIPLYNSDCRDSKTDESWLNETLHLQNNEKLFSKVDLEQLKLSLNDWFVDDYLNKLFPPENRSIEIANKWLQAGGKRWRPLIMLALNEALGNSNRVDSEQLAKLAIAIESFHKASLAHDDIADNDTERYGESSLLKKHSLEITLNTGDLLLSYGYQLIAQAGFDAETTQKLLSAAAIAHRELCLGQGEELLWQQAMKMPPVEKVIEIFANKTAPAFEVALKFGAIASNANPKMLDVIKSYSNAIGIAYQIKDDLDDFNPQNKNNDIVGYRPSLVLAILNEKYPQKMLGYLRKLNNGTPEIASEIYKWAEDEGAIDEAKDLLEENKQKALISLDDLDNISVKVLLYRLLNKIIG